MICLYIGILKVIMYNLFTRLIGSSQSKSSLQRFLLMRQVAKNTEIDHQVVVSVMGSAEDYCEQMLTVQFLAWEVSFAVLNIFEVWKSSILGERQVVERFLYHIEKVTF